MTMRTGASGRPAALAMEWHLNGRSVVVADNVLLPGAPDYRRYVKISSDFSTVEFTMDLRQASQLASLLATS